MSVFVSVSVSVSVSDSVSDSVPASVPASASALSAAMFRGAALSRAATGGGNSACSQRRLGAV